MLLSGERRSLPRRCDQKDWGTQKCGGYRGTEEVTVGKPRAFCLFGLVFGFGFRDKVSLCVAFLDCPETFICRLGWIRTQRSLASASGAQGSKACTTSTWLGFCLFGFVF